MLPKEGYVTRETLAGGRIRGRYRTAAYPKLVLQTRHRGAAVRAARDAISAGAVGRGLLYPSARVIALGRLLLAACSCSPSGSTSRQPALAPSATYRAARRLYAVFAAAMVAATWSNWWLDAQARRPRPRDRHPAVHGAGLPDRRLHQPLLHLLRLPAAGGGDPLGLAGDRADRDPGRRALSAGRPDGRADGGPDFELYRFMVRTGS